MLGTYAAAVAICAASLTLGQAAVALCGARRWSWLSPAVGLALLCAICWATVRLPGGGLTAALVVLAASIAAAAFLAGRLEGGGEALRIGWPVALGALLAATLPFAVEGHFGILGTGFNPDMSQHLLAADRLAGGDGSELLRQGYPLGPHALVVALHDGLGIGLVQGFSGLTVAVAVLAPLTALAVFREAPALPRSAAALVVGLAYVVASYFAQGAFKETIQALLLLAFVLSLREADRSPEWRPLPLRFVPAALIAAGSVYAYSFPGLLWLAATAAAWLLLSFAATRARGAAGSARALVLALLVFAVLVAPELGRMLDFQRFETFDPDGPGLGNLFGQLSPLEALGIWPSGDFRLAAGDGAVPAFAFYLAAAFALVLLVLGAIRCWRHRERAILAGLAAVALAYLAARLGGTPYTAAKAIEIAAPICALVILAPVFMRARPSPVPGGGAVGGPTAEEALATGGRGGTAATGPAGTGDAVRMALALFLVAAGASSVLALANAPVGPTSYSPALNSLRPTLAGGSTLVLAPSDLLAERHGERYLVWELRGGRVCVEGSAAVGGREAPGGVRFVVAFAAGAEGHDPTPGSTPDRPPFRGFELRRKAGPYLLWESTAPVRGPGPCPLIAVRQARQGPAR